MKTRPAQLKIERLAVDELTAQDVQNFIIYDCSSQREAAEFFNVDMSTIARWLSGATVPHKTCYSLLALYRQHVAIKEAA